jgi:hypothetical protein
MSACREKCDGRVKAALSGERSERSLDATEHFHRMHLGAETNPRSWRAAETNPVVADVSTSAWPWGDELKRLQRRATWRGDQDGHSEDENRLDRVSRVVNTTNKP